MTPHSKGIQWYYSPWWPKGRPPPPPKKKKKKKKIPIATWGNLNIVNAKYPVTQRIPEQTFPRRYWDMTMNIRLQYTLSMYPSPPPPSPANFKAASQAICLWVSLVKHQSSPCRPHLLTHSRIQRLEAKLVEISPPPALFRRPLTVSRLRLDRG